MPSPPPHVVRRLEAYDKDLRCRWAQHQALWAIEYRRPPRDRQFMKEMPNPKSTLSVQRDLYEGWRQGYVHVMFVHPDLLGAPIMWDTLARTDLQRQGGMEKFSAMLDAQDAAVGAAVDKEVHDLHGDLAGDIHDRIAWLDGRRQAVPNLEPVERKYDVQQRDGFVVHDRRVTA